MWPRLPVILLLFLSGGVLGPDIEVFAESPPVQAQVAEQVTLQAELVANGSTLLSIPLDLGGLDVGAWLIASGVSSRGVHGWDSRSQKYVTLKTVGPGQGFLLAHGPGKIPVSGVRMTAAKVESPLDKGWNLIGIPYEKDLPLAKLQVALEGKSVNLPVAVEKKWVGGVTALVDGKVVPLSAETGHLVPWRGYWLYAYQPCQLIFPNLQKDAEAQEKQGKRSKKR